jgi:hypothetical protein
MRNLLVDGLRQSRRQRALPEEPIEDPALSGWSETLEGNLDYQALFGPADLARVRGWPHAMRRIAILCRSLLWHKVPPAEWEAWCAAFGLELPFPPAGFADLPERERNQQLAQALGLKPATLHAHWHRGLPWLAELDYIQGLRS